MSWRNINHPKQNKKQTLSEDEAHVTRKRPSRIIITTQTNVSQKKLLWKNLSIIILISYKRLFQAE